MPGRKPMSRKDYPTKLRRLRKSRNLTLSKVSDLTGIPLPTYWNVETGRRRPSVATLQRIAAGFGVPVDEILEDLR